MGEDKLIPDCSCGAGQMTINCASSQAMNPGRYYYKCPSEKNHRRSFLWCDEYHSKHRPEHVPKFFASQTWSPSSATSSQTASNSPPVHQNETKVHHKEMPIQHAPSEELPIIYNELGGLCFVLFWVFTCVAIVFMYFVLVLLGVILGKMI